MEQVLEITEGKLSDAIDLLLANGFKVETLWPYNAMLKDEVGCALENDDIYNNLNKEDKKKVNKKFIMEIEKVDNLVDSEYIQEILKDIISDYSDLVV